MGKMVAMTRGRSKLIYSTFRTFLTCPLKISPCHHNLQSLTRRLPKLRRLECHGPNAQNFVIPEGFKRFGRNRDDGKRLTLRSQNFG
jgi:hypothetical protein